MKAIIFDFDGTLADTLPVCFYAFQAVFKEFDGLDIDSKQILTMFGPSETGIIRENLVNNNHEPAIELYYAKYLEKHIELVEDNEEITSLLTDLKSQGYLLAIVTGKARRSLDISLEVLGMDGFFDAIITGDDVDQPKPHPEGIHKVLNQFGLSPDQAVFIGDSDADIGAGLDAAVHTVGVQWLENYQTAEFSIQPDQFVESIADFRESLTKLR